MFFLEEREGKVATWQGGSGSNQVGPEGVNRGFGGSRGGGVPKYNKQM